MELANIIVGSLEFILCFLSFSIGGARPLDLLTSARILPIELQRLFSQTWAFAKKNVSTGGLGWRFQKYLMEDGRGRKQP